MNKITLPETDTKEMAEIDWSRDNVTICKLVCGMNSWPMAYTFYEGEPVKIISAEKCDDKEQENGYRIFNIIHFAGTIRM